MMNRTDTTDVLRAATVPVLFIMGTEDIAAPIKDVLQQCHLPQQSHIKIFENVGHMGMMEAAEELNAAMKIFVDLIS
jgi:pimeloyl-ACP methyl ester carboxylesterase